MSKYPLRAVAIMGATGTGKSALALTFAQQYETSIICCDSMQLYRGLDVGTAKASVIEQQQAPHFLLDCLTLPAIGSAQWWAAQAELCIKNENAQGRIPLIVGGTGLYLRALLQGFSSIPDEKLGVREHYEHLLQQHGPAFLHEKLRKVDNALAARLTQGDSQRIMRGLCVFDSTNVPLSQWQQQDKRRQQEQAARIQCQVLVLEKERSQLRQDLAKRFMKMMEEGFLDEVHWLANMRLPNTHPVMRAVGYRQLLDYVQGLCDLDAAIEKGITATRKYAKRQVTWFRNQTPDAIHGDAQVLAKQLHALRLILDDV